MITKERLKELIKQGATICNQYIDYNNNICYRFGKASIIQDDDGQHIELKLNGTNTSVIMYDTKYLFETEEDARWELEMTATRTETLRMPPFIEVCDGCIHDITFIDNKKCKWQLTISDNGIALLDFALLGRDKFWNKLTKENYIEACKLAKRLFLGE